MAYATSLSLLEGQKKELIVVTPPVADISDECSGFEEDQSLAVFQVLRRVALFTRDSSNQL